MPPDVILKARRERSKPILDEHYPWLEITVDLVLPKYSIGKAICYAPSQKEKIYVFLRFLFVPIDNNRPSSAIRPFVVARKNLIFADTPKEANASVTLNSLIDSAKANGLQPFEYLSHVFKELPKAQTLSDLGRLLPNRASAYL